LKYKTGNEDNPKLGTKYLLKISLWRLRRLILTSAFENSQSFPKENINSDKMHKNFVVRA
jgi:hypothetical protein